MFGEIIENRDSQSSPITNMLGVFMLGFVVRLLFLAWRGPDMPFDSSEYLTLARNILNQGAFSLDLSAGECSDVRQVYWPAFQIEPASDEHRIAACSG